MSPGWIDSTEAAMNAVLGDYLERRGSALAIEMKLSPQAAIRSSRIVVFVHGMAETEGCWSYPGEPTRSYGTELEAELGIQPLFVRYNTGRHVSQNGKSLAALLEELVATANVRIVDISLVGHSMGGLVIRSACHYAEELRMSWIGRARRAIYLGAPHLGAPLEKAGHLVSLALGAFEHPVVRLTRTVANLRSAGVKDLRHGSLLDEDWVTDDATPFPPETRLPLCTAMEHYLIAGTLTKSEDHFVAQLFGDALVRVSSATDPGRRAGLAEDHFAVFAGLHHRDLAHRPEVYAKIREWLGTAPAEPRPCAAEPIPLASASSVRALERVDAYLALLEDAVHHGATAVQGVQEELTAKPYDWIEKVPPLESPAKAVRTAHFAAIRGVYGMTRLVNRAVGAVLHEGIEWLKRA
jgi:pimeloyl-ACP methyl ester carboxylesterase